MYCDKFNCNLLHLNGSISSQVNSVYLCLNDVLVLITLIVYRCVQLCDCVVFLIFSLGSKKIQNDERGPCIFLCEILYGFYTYRCMLCIVSSETQTYAYSFAFSFPNYSCIQNLETLQLKITFCFDRFFEKKIMKILLFESFFC